LRKATLCILLENDSVLLGMKKRGFGQGRWNGFGGKVNEGETIEAATIRELKEESGIAADALEKVAVLDFLFSQKPDWNMQVHVFLSKEWEGEPRESDEMKPQWFNVDAIPFDSMWPDDKFWLPRVLKGEKLRASFTFAEGDKITSSHIEAVDELN